MAFLKQYEGSLEVGEGTSTRAWVRDSDMLLQFTNSLLCSDGHARWECQSSSFPASLGHRVGDFLVLDKENTYCPIFIFPMERWVDNKCLQLLSSPHFSTSWERGWIWRTCQLAWACPFWDFLSQPGHMILTFWFVLHDVIAGTFLQGEV